MRQLPWIVLLALLPESAAAVPGKDTTVSEVRIEEVGELATSNYIAALAGDRLHVSVVSPSLQKSKGVSMAEIGRFRAPLKKIRDLAAKPDSAKRLYSGHCLPYFTVSWKAGAKLTSIKTCATHPAGEEARFLTRIIHLLAR